jgi:hypothetical protein
MLGLKRFRSASITIAGIELMHRIRKGQFKLGKLRIKTKRRLKSGRQFSLHGSWLDMAESELAVLASQCLDRRVPDKQILIHHAAWESNRNAITPKPTGSSRPTTPASNSSIYTRPFRRLGADRARSIFCGRLGVGPT